MDTGSAYYYSETFADLCNSAPWAEHPLYAQPLEGKAPETCYSFVLQDLYGYLVDIS